MSRKRVHLTYTGGTIGMTHDGRHYVPTPGYLEEQLRAMPELADPSMPEFELTEREPLLDSPNMTPADWLDIAQSIADRYDDYDAFVVVHGTDTMAYTASALSYMLENLGKTVILTGSQIPLCELRSDGRDNLITSLLIAAGEVVPEVCIYFGNVLIRGNRARKIDAAGLDAFASPNLPPLGEAGTELVLYRRRIRPAPDAPFQIRRIGTPYVGEMRLFPGVRAQVVENFLKPPLQGLVLETFGVGNAPDRDPELLAALKAATDRGVVIVSCTQCLKGAVSLTDYATGACLSEAGVIPGFDMTPEAALTKLFYLFSLGLSADVVAKRMQQDLRGELTPPR